MPAQRLDNKVFGFVQWDSPLALILEVALSLAIIAGLLLLVRRVNSRAEAERRADMARTISGNESGAEGQHDQ